MLVVVEPGCLVPVVGRRMPSLLHGCISGIVIRGIKAEQAATRNGVVKVSCVRPIFNVAFRGVVGCMAAFRRQLCMAPLVGAKPGEASIKLRS